MTRDEICEKFLDALPFEPYPFQEEALLAWFSAEQGLLVCAPTGMGKTLIAEAAIFEALHARKRLYYTTPLIALTDQKFREIQARAEQWGFPREEIGLITGNRKVNPDALVRVVVAEILLNHLLSSDSEIADLEQTGAVVMDEFHSFNDLERGIVWELSLVLLPRHVRVMLLSATVGNPYDFATWLKKEHVRSLDIVLTQERRVPLEFVWIEDKLLTEHLPRMVEEDRVPALVFCFNRDECWDVAERLKGLPLISGNQKKEIEQFLDGHKEKLVEGAGSKLRQMLLRGVGVHHAGVLPMHKEIIEELFLRKLVPFVVCTETLAAGINLPARSVVLSTLLKGPPRDKKLIPASSAHQMFGRAGRPQFDTQGYVYAVAHDDDVKINKWRLKYEQLGDSKDPGILRAKKDLERKRPSRRKTEQYWAEGQFRTLIEAGPAKLFSRSMIPYSVLVFLLTKTHSLERVRDFMNRRFNSAERIEKFQNQLTHMLENLQALGYLTLHEDRDHVTLDERIFGLLGFRSIDPLYGDFLAQRLVTADERERILALESVLDIAPSILRKAHIPDDLPKGPLQENELEPLMVQMGIVLAQPEPDEEEEYERPRFTSLEEVYAEEEERPPTFPEMLKIEFEAKLAVPDPIRVQPKWMAGNAFEFDGEFYKYVKSRDLVKQEGIVLRHLLRFVILAGEIEAYTSDPTYAELAERAATTCRRVDEKHTERFLSEAEAVKKTAAADLKT